MQRADITVKGKVQRAGYRDNIDKVAYEHGLTGYVKNLEDGTVKVVCEGEKEDIENFLEEIDIDNYPIKVTNIDIEYSEATGEFEYFDLVREEDFTKAVYERMDIAADYLGNIYEETKAVHKETKKVHEETKKVHEETKNVGKKVDKGFSDVKEELGDISGKLDRSIEHTEEFHNETVDKFDYLDVKYGEFSTTLDQLLNKFDVLEGDIREMKDAFVKLVDHYTK